MKKLIIVLGVFLLTINAFSQESGKAKALLDEVAEKVDRIVKELAWEGEVFTMSAYSRQGTEELSIKLLDYIQALPVDDDEQDENWEGEEALLLT
mgnify:CR=1 FL=1